MTDVIPKLKVLSREISDDYITYEVAGWFSLTGLVANKTIAEMVDHKDPIVHYEIVNEPDYKKTYITIFTKSSYRWRRQGNAIGANESMGFTQDPLAVVRRRIKE